MCLADQPKLTARDIGRIQSSFEERRPAVLVPRYHGRRGNPIVLARDHLDDILKRDGNFGCRQFVARNPDIVETVEMDSDRILLDVDRREDLEELDLGHPEPSGDRATL